MPVTFTPGQLLQQGDLDIFFADGNGGRTNVYDISYDLYYVDPGPPETEVLIAPSPRVPVNPSLGEYYAALLIPPSATLGFYRIKWTFQQYSGGPVSEVVQEFEVVDPDVNLVQFSSEKQDLINRLRILLRDFNPDKYYHFVPPEHEGRIGQYNRVFGYIWEDRELCEYLENALDWWNMYPPETEYLCSLEVLIQQKPVWRSALFWGAIVQALMALAINWAHEEFSVTGDTPIRLLLPSGEQIVCPIEDLYGILSGRL